MSTRLLRSHCSSSGVRPTPAVRERVASWARRFSPDYYRALFRLFGWHYQGHQQNPPAVIGQITLRWVYDVIMPREIIEEIRNRKRLSDKAHQWLSEGGLAQALVECVSRFGVGARVYLDELKADNKISTTAALFSETQARVLVSVGREDEVKFIGLCEQRGIPVTRIGVTDTEPTLEIQHIASWPIADLKSASEATLPELFA